jgi:hypothetical protein
MRKFFTYWWFGALGLNCLRSVRAYKTNTYDKHSNSQTRKDIHPTKNTRIARDPHDADSTTGLWPEHPKSSKGQYQHAIGPEMVSIQPSPQCWSSALTSTGSLPTRSSRNDIDAEIFCANLPETQQKRLALEITRCHLQDLQQPLEEDPANSQSHVQLHCQPLQTDAASRTGTTAPEVALYDCLGHLTPLAGTIYTQFFAYVQVWCVRLTQQALLQAQQESSRQLSAQYEDIAHASLQQLDALVGVSAQHVLQMQQLTNLPDQVQNRVTLALEAHVLPTLQQEVSRHLSHELRAQLQLHLGPILERHVAEHTAFLKRVLDRAEVRDAEQEATFQSWTTYQTTVWQQQVREMERYRTAVAFQQEQIANLADTVQATTTRLQPLAGLDSLIQTATAGYTYVTFLLHVLGTLNVLWLLTLPRRCRTFRSYLVAIVMTEAALELLLTAAVSTPQPYLNIDDGERIRLITELRKYALFLECVGYVAGIVSSLFPTYRNVPAEEEYQNCLSYHNRLRSAKEDSRPRLRETSPLRQSFSSAGGERGVNFPTSSENYSPRYGPLPPIRCETHTKTTRAEHEGDVRDPEYRQIYRPTLARVGFHQPTQRSVAPSNISLYHAKRPTTDTASFYDFGPVVSPDSRHSLHKGGSAALGCPNEVCVARTAQSLHTRPFENPDMAARESIDSESGIAAQESGLSSQTLQIEGSDSQPLTEQFCMDDDENGLTNFSPSLEQDQAYRRMDCLPSTYTASNESRKRKRPKDQAKEWSTSIKRAHTHLA